MRIAVSNIAWNVSDDAAMAQLLQRHGVDAIDVAPGKYFPQPAQALASDIAKIRNWWEERGVEIVGMQALLFGTTGLNVFGEPDVQNAMLTHLEAVCRIGGELGATKLVFGSPRNRDRSSLSDEQTRDQALSFFQRLGDIAQQHGVVICLEPNPTCYGANFMTTSSETAHIVNAVSHPAIRMQLDTGAVTLNHESISQVLADYGTLIGHVHLSEPELAPLGDRGSDHGAFHAAIEAALPRHVLSIEMLATTTEPPLVSVERALAFANAHYRPEWRAAP